MKIVLFNVLLFLFPFLNFSNEIKKTNSPNFIIILVDDQGWNGTSVQMMDEEINSKSDFYQTPNLEKFAKKGIRINGIAPGNIIFKDSVWDKKNKSNPRQVKKIIDENVALKRLGEISDITSLVKFLSSPDSAFITGAIVPADGGQLR